MRTTRGRLIFRTKEKATLAARKETLFEFFGKKLLGKDWGRIASIPYGKRLSAILKTASHA